MYFSLSLQSIDALSLSPPFLLLWKSNNQFIHNFWPITPSPTSAFFALFALTITMGFRDHGYYGYAFIGTRPMQIISLIVVVGMVGNFISEDSHVHVSASGQLIGTLVIVCFHFLSLATPL